LKQNHGLTVLHNVWLEGMKIQIILKCPLERTSRYVEGIWMSMYWSFGARTNRGSYSQCFLVSAHFWFCLRFFYLFKKPCFETSLPISWICCVQKPFWFPLLKLSLNILFAFITESLFLKNVSTANARCTADHLSMFTKWRP
jgi:hypothetical protein